MLPFLIAAAAACPSLHPAWAERLGYLEEAERAAAIAERSGHVPCSVVLDLDGDKKPDTASPVVVGERVAISVALGSGEEVRLGVPGTGAVLKEFDVPHTSGFGWMVSWSAVPRGADGLVHTVLWHKVPVPGALGDGLLISSLDLTLMLVKKPAGWELVNFGY